MKPESPSGLVEDVVGGSQSVASDRWSGTFSFQINHLLERLVATGLWRRSVTAAQSSDSTSGYK